MNKIITFIIIIFQFKYQKKSLKNNFHERSFFLLIKQLINKAWFFLSIPQCSSFSEGSYVELVSKELNHLAAILHVYAGGLNFMK